MVAGVLSTVLAVVVAPTAAAQPSSGFAAADDATITPGVEMLTPVGTRTASSCTAAFVFTGNGAVYIGYSAHCASFTEPMSPRSGCEEDTLPLGSEVLVQRTDGGESVGTLAYSSWTAMQERGETDEALCQLNDFALVELDPDDVAAVNPSVPLIGGPTGLDTGGTEPGEPVFSYQPNITPGDPVKVGESLGDTSGGLTHRVMTEPSPNPGDSGSGYLDGGGAAFGVLSTELIGRERANGVTDLAMALGYANRFGDVGQVRLVRGTEPFTG